MNRLDLSRVNVYEMLETLGMRNLSETEEEVQFSCPLSGHLHGDAHPSAYMNKETTAWICHGCHAKGNAISFLSQVYNITPLEATRALRNEFDNTFKEPVTSMRNELEGYLKYSEQEPEKQRYLDESVLERFPLNERAREYAAERGFSGKTVEDWEIGFDEISNRITFPVRDATGKIVGVKGRTLESHPAKYVVLGDVYNLSSGKYGFPTYEVSHVLFGIHRYLQEKCEQMILCEGEFNAIALWQKGFPGAVAIGGSHLSEAHIKSIKSHAKSIVLFFDSDEAGIDVTCQAIDALEPFMPVKVTPYHEGDPAEMSTSQIRQCLKDAKSSLMLMFED